MNRFLDPGRPPFWWTVLGAAGAALVLALALTYVVVREPAPRAVAAPRPALTPTVTPSEAADPSASGSAAEAPAPSRTGLDRAIAGTWAGAYRCGQGRTGVTLVITPVVEGKFRATFRFYAVADNPGVPSGEYAMVGVRSVAGVVLVGERWIRRPGGYLMVGLIMDVPETAPRHMEGKVTGEECGTIVLDKQSEEWSDPPV